MVKRNGPDAQGAYSERVGRRLDRLFQNANQAYEEGNRQLALLHAQALLSDVTCVLGSVEQAFATFWSEGKGEHPITPTSSAYSHLVEIYDQTLILAHRARQTSLLRELGGLEINITSTTYAEANKRANGLRKLLQDNTDRVLDYSSLNTAFNYALTLLSKYGTVFYETRRDSRNKQRLEKGYGITYEQSQEIVRITHDILGNLLAQISKSTINMSERRIIDPVWIDSFKGAGMSDRREYKAPNWITHKVNMPEWGDYHALHDTVKGRYETATAFLNPGMSDGDVSLKHSSR
ncbi:hypothetical protein COY95_01355 [Candidatus Woesearchaeota archaeon CG_4_10_14_0_8_um_filter_47_5]|nr:MAG: hypothetical protein COY95_01355 [Candidatus Woesearchaeota archaeon CG_4_10_14_0_8_um_filter_47_5]